MGGPGNRTARLSKRFRVRSFEADPLGRLQVPILCRLLQEAATAHAAELGVAVDALVDSGVAWVLNRLDLHVQRWPRSDDEIVIETWPSAMNRLLTERRFRIVDSSGQETGRASTLWLVLDLERRRPVRLPWVVEAVPDQVWSACNLSNLSIQFLAECRRGQTVLSRSQLLGDDDTPEVRHQLIREEDGVEVARALTTWCPHKLSERQRSNVSTF
jgi:acyl-CoA thioesterase FadM